MECLDMFTKYKMLQANGWLLRYFVCVYVHVCVDICMHVHVHTYVSMCVRTCVSVYMPMWSWLT